MKSLIKTIVLSIYLVFGIIPATISAQNNLHLIGDGVDIYPSAMDISFTKAGQKQLLCEHELDLAIYSSYIITFEEPVDVDSLCVETGGEEVIIPKGVRSFQGFITKGVYTADVLAPNGEESYLCFDLLFLKAKYPTKLRITEVKVIRKDGTEEICYGYESTYENEYWAKTISFLASDGSEFTDYYETDWETPEVSNITSGRVYISDDGALGGAAWASNPANAQTIYEITFNKPVPSNYLAWKYITTSGDLRYQPIENGSISNKLSIDDAVKECSIVNTQSIVDTDEKTLFISSITIQDVLPSGVSSVKVLANKPTRYFDITGRPIKTLRKGVNIVNGKKKMIILP